MCVNFAEQNVAQIQFVQLVLNLKKTDSFVTQNPTDEYVFSFELNITVLSLPYGQCIGHYIREQAVLSDMNEYWRRKANQALQKTMLRAVFPC